MTSSVPLTPLRAVRSSASRVQSPGSPGTVGVSLSSIPLTSVRVLPDHALPMGSLTADLVDEPVGAPQ